MYIALKSKYGLTAEKNFVLLWRRFVKVITCNYVLDSKKKPEISYPTQFEHTIHVGFDPVTSEFTVSRKVKLSIRIFALDFRLKRNQILL